MTLKKTQNPAINGSSEGDSHTQRMLAIDAEQQEREAQLARQEEAQIDAFVRGVLGEKQGERALRREKLKPRNEGLQGKTPEAGCSVM